MLLEFLYRDQLPSCLTSRESLMKEISNMGVLFNAYVAGDKYFYEQLQNEMINVIAEVSKK